MLMSSAKQKNLGHYFPFSKHFKEFIHGVGDNLQDVVMDRRRFHIRKKKIKEDKLNKKIAHAWLPVPVVLNSVIMCQLFSCCFYTLLNNMHAVFWLTERVSWSNMCKQITTRITWLHIFPSLTHVMSTTRCSVAMQAAPAPKTIHTF